MTQATCAGCSRPIPFLPPGNETPDDCVDVPDALQTSVFVGDLERRLHWTCYEAEQEAAQAVMFA